jgi:hypothetical protein
LWSALLRSPCDEGAEADADSSDQTPKMHSDFLARILILIDNMKKPEGC